MARPVKPRSIETPPTYFQFEPDESRKGTAPGENVIQLKLDEWEVYRLTHYLGMDHAQGAAIMGISRPTYTRLVDSASKKLARMLMEGKTLLVSGGRIRFANDVYCCKECQRPFQWDKKKPPLCPECGAGKALIPHPECQGDCSCCEELTPKQPD